jgi:hypothetical protein
MILLYLDESGGFSETDQTYYVLGGVSTFERQPYFMSKDLDDFQKELFPESTDYLEFHASSILNGNGEPWKSVPKTERLQILNRIYKLLAETKSNVSLFAVAFHKPSFPTQDPVQRTCEEVSGHFDSFLSRLESELPSGDKQRGLMIFDQSSHEKTLQALMNQFRSTGASFGRIKHLAEVPMFTDSKITRMLQYADLVAYAVFRRYERGDSRFLDLIAQKFDQSAGRLHGLTHLVANYQECFCPACLTRRTPPTQI